MFARACPVCLALALVLTMGLSAQVDVIRDPQRAVQPKEREDDNRRFFKPPQTALEFWRAVQLEINLGQYDLAADFLRGLMTKGPTDEELLQMEDRDGTVAFLRLLSIARWVDDPKDNAEVQKLASALVERMGEARRKFLSDPIRLNRFIENLSAGPEERAFAIAQLRRSGAYAVPPLIDALIRDKDDAARRNAILTAMSRLGPAALPALAAALDLEDPQLRLDLVQALARTDDPDLAPHLWYLAGSPKQPEAVRQQASQLLGRILGQPVDRLPSPKVALTQEAERYLQHRVPFANPQKVTVWRWDGKQVVPAIVPASKAEEYFGLRFAGQALDIDPTYEPAQVVFLSVALDKALGRAGLDQPLSKGAPDVKELLSTVNPEVLHAVLDRALRERRTPVVLGAVRALGDALDSRAASGAGRGRSGLLVALDYPDRRVQMAAADALLKVSNSANPPRAARIVDILRRNLAADTARRVLVAYGNADVANAIAAAVRQAGFDAVVVQSGTEALQRLNQAADIDLVLLDGEIPDPRLPYVLAQLRVDSNFGLVPVLVMVPARQVPLQEELVRRYRNVWVVPATADTASLKKLLTEKVEEAMGKPLSEAEKQDFALLAATWLKRLATGEVRGYNLEPAAKDIRAALRKDELAAAGAIEAASRLSGRDPQLDLATLVLSPNRPAALRSLAAVELTRNLQQRGTMLTPAQIEALETAFTTATDPQLKSNLALVLGGLRPSARQTGERLRRFAPSLDTSSTAPETNKESGGKSDN